MALPTFTIDPLPHTHNADGTSSDGEGHEGEHENEAAGETQAEGVAEPEEPRIPRRSRDDGPHPPPPRRPYPG